MKYETTGAFDRDFRRLGSKERRLFRQAVEKFIPAAERVGAGEAVTWPRSLRVKDVEGAVGVWELTWNFAGPDGRATWEWVEIEGERGVRWRRIGDHSIFGEP